MSTDPAIVAAWGERSHLPRRAPDPPPPRPPVVSVAPAERPVRRRSPHRGLAHHNTRFTPEEVDAIRWLWNLPEDQRPSQRQIARVFRTKQPYVSQIVHGKVWAEGPVP